MDSRRPQKNASTTSSRQERVHTTGLTQRQPVSNNANQKRNLKRNPAPSQLPPLGKRTRIDSHEPSENGSSSTAKRPCQTSLSSNNELCSECSELRWDKLEPLMDKEMSMTWRGKLVHEVGTRYRTITSKTTCPLCRQLYAPWIEDFINKQGPTERKKCLGGDLIHIFRNLRHLAHMNDYPAGRKLLRENDAPYHIAVVPAVTGWKNELSGHIKAKGMVIVRPKVVPETELFAPQVVAKHFDPDLVLPWIKFCKNHKKLCSIESPKVDGMKVIDCRSDEPFIRKYSDGQPYVALSYVWGKSPPGPLKPGSADTWKFKKEYTDGRLVSELPKDLPQTIKDAISVTRDLGYRFLWVDKYCIDQDNVEEQREQCSRMGDIYAGSQLTIFALGPDSDYGLPGVSSTPRKRRRQCMPIGNYRLITTLPDPQLSIQKSLWSTRGWTYQEGLFSTRRLFFTDFQVYFECNAMNCVEDFKSDLKILHILNSQRFRAFHRSGQFICGNSNQYSHLNVSKNTACHRKIDIIHRCQYQIRQYTKREFTNGNDILNAFSGIAHFYAGTTAKIISLAGIPIPFPIANLDFLNQERLDHLSYALAWTHRQVTWSDWEKSSSIWSEWNPYDNPKPQRRDGFPSWSWAGWFGEVAPRKDLPFRWTSILGSVRIGYEDAPVEDYAATKKYKRYKHYLIKKLLTANVLHFDAYVLDPEYLDFGEIKPYLPPGKIPLHTIQTFMSTGSRSLDTIRQKLLDKKYECLVLGTYGEPRKRIFKAIQALDKLKATAKNRRIETFKPGGPDSIVCLVVRTAANGRSRRIGILKVIVQIGEDHSLDAWGLKPPRSFILE